MKFVADFETTTNADNCRVWAWATCEIGDTENCHIGTDIGGFMWWCENASKNLKIYFHNLRFDGQWIITWLLKNGFRHVTDSHDRASRTFQTMISSKGLFYGIEVVFYLKGKTVKKVTFFDSLKLLPMSVDKIAKSFNMPYRKGRIDYDRHNNLPEGSPISDDEKEYILGDVKIIATALDYFFANGLDRITIGSCAMAEYRRLVGEKNFKRWFPFYRTVHEDIRQCYRGGFTYVDPAFENREVENGLVLDKNAMYSSVMKEKILPYGTPIFFNGEYKPDELYPLYIQMLRCSFRIKEGKIPTIQFKGNFGFGGNEYVTSSNHEEVVLCLTNVDLELFLEQYDVFNPEYMSGWKFKAKKGMFDVYIDKWQREKEEAIAAGDGGRYLIAKRMLNALYGKYGVNEIRRSKYPYMDKDGVLRYNDLPPQKQDGLYLPVAIFTTSYARQIVVKSAQRIKDDYASGKSDIQFAYCDTDSLHVYSKGFEIPDFLEIDNIKLGKWKIENHVRRAKYIRQKCYMMQTIITPEEYEKGIESDDKELYLFDDEYYYKNKVVVAGMPSECHKHVTFENFEIGATYEGNLKPEHVPGGVILTSIDFTIKK